LRFEKASALSMSAAPPSGSLLLNPYPSGATLIAKAKS
jgi:hypothetical protein